MRKVDHLEKLIQAHREGDKLAVETALTAAKEMAQQHNDLIRAAEKRDETYASKADLSRVEAFQARLTGAFIILSLIGVSNLVKLWAG